MPALVATSEILASTSVASRRDDDAGLHRAPNDGFVRAVADEKLFDESRRQTFFDNGSGIEQESSLLASSLGRRQLRQPLRTITSQAEVIHGVMVLPCRDRNQWLRKRSTFGRNTQSLIEPVMSRDLSEFIRELNFVAGDDDNGARLDHFVGDKVFWRSRTDIKSRIKNDRILLNDKPAKPAARLRKGDRVVVIVQPEDLPDQDPADVPLDIIDEDDSIVVLNKGVGMLVHPTGRHVYDTLINALFLRYRRSGADKRGVVPHVVHRLDRNTSGVLVIAKSEAVKQTLQDDFEARRPRKSYLALVEGCPSDLSGEIAFDLERDPDAEIRVKMRAVPPGGRGQKSLTEFEVVERFTDHDHGLDHALVRAWPKTGRQHQIRVHLAALGHAILADPLYGDPRSVGPDGAADAVLHRQALHAESLELPHPVTRKPMRWTAPLPGDMQTLVDALRAGKRLTRFEDRQSQHWKTRR